MYFEPAATLGLLSVNLVIHTIDYYHNIIYLVMHAVDDSFHAILIKLSTINASQIINHMICRFTYTINL